MAWAEHGSYHGLEGLLSTNPLRFTDVAHRPRMITNGKKSFLLFHRYVCRPHSPFQSLGPKQKIVIISANLLF